MLLFAAVVTVSPATAQDTPTPTAQGYRGASQDQTYRGAFSDLAIEIDAFWAETFSTEGTGYESPDIFVVERETQTACGLIVPQPNALYCPFDRTIYLIPQFLIDMEQQFGDYAPITILSHEWGHHIQALLSIEGLTRKEGELQADCLMGVFTRHADDAGLLDYGDFTEALATSGEGGDAVFLPEDAPGAHGQPEDRVKALTRGYGGGPETGCNLSLSDGSDTSNDRNDDPVESSEIFDYLPSSPPLTHADCFDKVDEGSLNFEQLLGRFTGVEDAEARLQTWDWQASVFRQFGCEGPPDGDAGWIDISVHLFGDSLAAMEAVDYFAAVRAEGGPLFPVEPPAIGEHAAALSGPATNGTEFTIYASQGPLLVRVTGVSPSGIPFINVLTVTQAVLTAQPAQPQVTQTPPVQVDVEPASAYLPTVPAVRHRECFEVLTEGTYDYSDVVDAIEPTGLGPAQFDELGWRDGAYIVFTCAEPPVGRATQIDVGIHQFQDVPSAQQALPHYSSMYRPGENETRSCNAAGTLVVCVSGRSLSGSPLSDVQFVLNQVTADVGT
ncbi:MAG: neutral zinc metallopeptidase [Chloroflexia bacterium]|nr:neutral zinc metallopeptidase [Chloroflexia bacterium]